MMRTFNSVLITLLVCAAGLVGAKDKPDIAVTEFDHIPAYLFYFDDTDTTIFTDPVSHDAHISFDAGAKWQPLEGVSQGEVLSVHRNPYHNTHAVAVGLGTTHWITKDQGKTWQDFSTPAPPTMARSPIAFHGSDPERMIFHASECLLSLFDCQEKAYYTTIGFDKDPLLLHDDAIICLWSKSTDLLAERNPDMDDDEVLCIVRGDFSPFSSSYRLLKSNDFFKTKGTEPAMDNGRIVNGIVNLASVKSYIVAAASSKSSRELAMFVTTDAVTWQRAAFGPHQLEQDAYTLLESTNYSMQVDVMTGRSTSPMGTLFTSNSNGTFFANNLKHTNRNTAGFVDFEKVSSIQGIVIANTVQNWQEVEESGMFAEKHVVSAISFDDGRTWQPLKTEDGDDLHLHSVTDQANSGRIFSSPAPGIVMGVGNTGSKLKPRPDGDTWVSDNGGLTWRKALKGPHIYEFGDQGAILVAVESYEAKKIKWSLNHGQDWDDMKFEDDIIPIALTTTPDSTSLKFVLTVSKGKDKNSKFAIYALDFEGLHEKTCKDTDFEDWHARVDDDGEPMCIMGHTQTFRRRRASSLCFVDDEFHEPLAKQDDCACSEADYECDPDFTREDGKADGKCIPGGLLKSGEGQCADGEATYQGPSGYRLIPGNTCDKKLQGAVILDEPVERSCEDVVKKPATGQIAVEITDNFLGSSFAEFYYLERGENAPGEDESLVMRTDKQVYYTFDHGKKWRPILEEEEVVAIYPHQYINDNVYFITRTKRVFYSENRGRSLHHFDAPEAPNMDRLQILSFHPNMTDWLIWTGSKEGEQTIAHVSKKGGEDWQTLLRSVRKCQFVYSETRPSSLETVYCEQYENEDENGKLVLLSSDDMFESRKELKKDVVNFATMAEYIVVAVRNEERETLSVDASIDAATFADARWPSNFHVDHQQAYTVLDSSTHAVFLHVTVNGLIDQEYGSIVKSNSNGTNYVLSINDVNRNRAGYVDFEKMQGLEGVAVVNVVANRKEVTNGRAKKLKTLVTHNDGAEWSYLTPPKTNVANQKYCSGDLNRCSLHLHGYTERRDPRDTYSSPSAIGLMIGVGNVGEYLLDRGAKETGTFLTSDGGISWTNIASGSWTWEFGDQGSIIVIVQEDEPVRDIRYSLDEGKSWKRFTFMMGDYEGQDMVVDDITTVPSDTSRNFILWGKIDGKIATVNLDFSSLPERSEPCGLDENDPASKDNDYYLWSPRHPLQKDDCLFGHVSEYHRKITDRQCYNGKSVQHLHAIARNCSCTRQDFECDYNYERQSDGSCRLVPGEQPPDPQAVCLKDPDLTEYYMVTGYRRIPLTTCSGGRELDFTSYTKPCPNHDAAWRAKHRLGGVALFFVIVIPIAAAAAIGYWVYQNWDGKFGRIRLGDGGGGIGFSTDNFFDREAPWIKYPVMAISAVAAVVAALPMVAASVYRTLKTRFGRNSGRYGGYNRPYTSRSSFARGRGDYAVVDPDEGELLGEDSDDDV